MKKSVNWKWPSFGESVGMVVAGILVCTFSQGFGQLILPGVHPAVQFVTGLIGMIVSSLFFSTLVVFTVGITATYREYVSTR